MTRHIPNLLTSLRFFMAIGFFIILGFYDVQSPPSWPILDIAFVVFLVAVLTDIVDGWLARKLGHLTTFGRIADPFVDKIIVCGALAYFIGDQFVRSSVAGGLSSTDAGLAISMPHIIKENLTGWRPWMVAVIIARELLVTGMRSFSEAHRIPFAASLSGKIKMFIQCVAICWSIFYVEHWIAGPDWTRVVRDGLIWTTTLVTAFSGLVYIKRAYDLLRLPPD
jgi:CDP-diacylglycerol---glycerol-3-phosphate 3-phosphatidyltransferase